MPVRWVLLLSSYCLLTCAIPAAAQWAVYDAAVDLKVWMQYGTQIEQYAEQVQQTKQQIQMVANQLKNLKNLNFNDATSLLGLFQSVQGKYNQARQLGFQAQNVLAQAQALYPRVQSVVPGATLRQYQQRWAAAQREAAAIGTQIQAMQGQQQALMQKSANLLTQGAGASGNLDIQQAQLQMHGLVLTELLSLEDQNVIQGRQQSMKDLKDATMEEAAIAVRTEATQDLNISGVASGQILSLTK
jgi:P-type conjugative transfer protein TrbJ